MIEQDTIKLLRECDAGVKMGISSIEDVLNYVKNDDLKSSLSKCKSDHEAMQTDIENSLHAFNDIGKSPNPIAKSMSKMKTNVKMSFEGSDQTVADLITDGCNMGVKSLSRYLNQYKAADKNSKDITKKLIKSEEQLAIDIRKFL